MIFSDLYRSPRSPFSKLRVSHPHGVPLPPDLDADLVSKDKARQKEAVRRFLIEKIRDDWNFVWPPALPSQPLASEDVPTSEAQAVVETPDSTPAAPAIEDDAPRDPGEEADSESDAESVYSTVSEDQVHFRPRLEWTSDLSDDDEPPASASPFRFDSPDAVGAVVSCSSIARQTRRRRAVREEVTWNPGLACFEARRNAWTGAKTVRVKPKAPSPISPSSPRRLFWRHHRSGSAASSHGGIGSGSPPSVSSPLSPTTTRTSQQTDASTVSHPSSEQDLANAATKTTPDAGVQRTSSQESSHGLYAVETLIPVPPPLLPSQNPMRASVTPSIYPSLYDKIVVHSLQPSCPVNLGDMIRACVVGWKRDGEWPPRPTMAATALTAMELAAIRHRKAAAAQQQHAHARKASTATVGSSRRLSFGFLGGNKVVEEKESRDAKENGSDEGAGKGIRRSLQKVFSLGHVHTTGSTPLSPTSPVSANPTLTATG
ncbi:hypothetical protein B0T25DRAFT_309493 [Lasiosphaeria hispida]|uniref:Gag1-like clamp domain-containing protein n=1 Tax=Lasiosphaeria hispida TaxID=260671 RepID=A0AAJ0H8P6_9PEZI|nr:hypothetical protein B0T25DRAFT_309493 [Lasiosphaeria hispida]